MAVSPLKFLTVIALMVTLGLSACSGPVPTGKADRIIIEKSDHRMGLYQGDRLLVTYTVALGKGGPEAKTREGDGRTPEGRYMITEHKEDSAFHRALRLSYPNAEDKERAAKLGLPAGGDIMIHGMRNGLGFLGFMNTWVDWTDGCIAVTNGEIDEIWSMVDNGTVVDIMH